MEDSFFGVDEEMLNAFVFEKINEFIVFNRLKKINLFKIT